MHVQYSQTTEHVLASAKTEQLHKWLVPVYENEMKDTDSITLLHSLNRLLAFCLLLPLG